MCKMYSNTTPSNALDISNLTPQLPTFPLLLIVLNRFWAINALPIIYLPFKKEDYSWLMHVPKTFFNLLTNILEIILYNSLHILIGQSLIVKASKNLGIDNM